GGASAAVNQTITIAATAELQGGTLAVPGTAGDDLITLTPVLPAGAAAYGIRVTSNGVVLGTFAPAGGAVQVYGGPGNDTATANGSAGDDAFAAGSGTLGLTVDLGTAQT